MEINPKMQSPAKSHYQALIRWKPDPGEIQDFKEKLNHLHHLSVGHTDKMMVQKLVCEFLKDIYSSQRYLEARGVAHIVMHNNMDASSGIGLLIEVSHEEVLDSTIFHLRATQNLLLHYLYHFTLGKHHEISHLILTDGSRWYIFNAAELLFFFEQHGALADRFKTLLNEDSSDWYSDRIRGKIAQPAIELLKTLLSLDVYSPSDNQNAGLGLLYKLLNPAYLSKQGVENESRQSDSAFYQELLYILGLKEFKDGNKTFIGRLSKGERQRASLLEMVIKQLDSKVVFYRVENLPHFGRTYEEQLFQVGLELVITWISRILYLKLIESRLLALHQGDKMHQFMNLEKIRNFDDLDRLFFDVLSRRPASRSVGASEQFALVPYLNTVLFEPTDLEFQALFISNLKDGELLPLYSSTILKSSNGSTVPADQSTLAYLLSFLNAFDFSFEEIAAVSQPKQYRITAKSLSQFFNKVIRHQSGFVFVPEHLTQQMCRKAIRQAVLQKFNSTKRWRCDSIPYLRSKINNPIEANNIINSLRICDPAVGAGNILVMVLNELLLLKSELGIWQDAQGRLLDGYALKLIEGELVVLNSQAGIFQYQPDSAESQRVQEALFHEKQIIVEQCLSGVDTCFMANVNQLNLWIELAKSVYYLQPIVSEELSSPVCYAESAEVNDAFRDSVFSRQRELQVLPNIDINIKSGNALICRFPLEADLSQAFKNSRYSVVQYKEAVKAYHQAKSKEQRQEAYRLLSEIKSEFRSEMIKAEPRLLRLQQLNGELYVLLHHVDHLDVGVEEKEARREYVNLLYKEIDKLTKEMSEVNNNPTYEAGFEWRVEFPEALSSSGSFEGFDVVISALMASDTISSAMRSALQANYITYDASAPLHFYYIELGAKLLRAGGEMALLLPDDGKLNSEGGYTEQWMNQLKNIRLTNVKYESGVGNPLGTVCLYNIKKPLL